MISNTYIYGMRCASFSYKLPGHLFKNYKDIAEKKGGEYEISENLIWCINGHRGLPVSGNAKCCFGGYDYI
jgi:hypothetical protein